MVSAEISGDLTVSSRYDDESVRRFRELGYWRDGSAAALLDHWADTTPDRPYVSDGVADLTYGDTRDRAYRLGARLLELGVRPGDRVVVQLPNWSEFIVSYLALGRIGAVMVPIMMVYRDAEVEHVLANSDAVAAITTGTFRSFDHAAMFRGLQSSSPSLRHLVIARADPAPGETSFDEASGAGAAIPGADVLGPYPDPDLPHVIVYTSGTESTAKGCVHTWNTLDFSGRGLATDVFAMTDRDVMFMPSPVAHATGLVVGVLVPLTVGAPTHLLDVWEPTEALRRIERYGCTTSASATPFVRMALDAARSSSSDISSMRFWLCAGAPIPPALGAEFSTAFSGGLLMPLYGCSEIMAGTSCHLEDPPEKRSTSDGSPALAGVEITLMGPDGEDAAPGEEGEICYWGPGAILGYWREPERTAATIDSRGRHHTGDLGRADADGFVRVTGRLKDIIIRGGTNISAGEVEGHLSAHPSVAGVAVVAYPDERMGERACAVVVPADGATPTLEELTGFLRTERRISPQKLPEKLVLVDQMPMTATGKVQKFRLRELAAGA
ncbi:cyclohexanecarboxylate-CoA ligase/acyl-CoA synthetase [Pseudonocardia sediminis]|uniref:Cyclohexanecarboxylate-CoA ligase/acyl-CoA synthetase n=2 Tax=Pseudonocardia sediminis TaxID=1397368 RepID=A0A4Q7V276_PSEST|nr:cyclohexanecarboxylate-CoA ligase/acyl-CoA synthetase [Pseudonocardia sediminis]